MLARNGLRIFRSGLYPRVSFDSSLLLAWAQNMRSLTLGEGSLGMPGISAVVEAASSRLEYVSLECNTVLAAAQAGWLLSSCSRRLAVEVEGMHSPTSFPPNMHSLFVCFGSQCVIYESPWDPLMPHALLFSLARQQPPLEQLSLEFDVPSVPLGCAFYLPRLSIELEITLSDDTHCNLSWLRNQSCRRLSMILHLHTLKPSQHDHIFAQLQPLPLDNLTIRCSIKCTRQAQTHLQQRWHRLGLCGVLIQAL